LSQLRFRGGRVLTLASGILVAAVSFVLLTSAVTTSELRVRGTVEENFRPAYDVLVRPRGSFTPLEKEEGLVRANYLSGIFGGISRAQYERIRAMDGVEVAAPIANLGYVLPGAEIPLRVDDVLGDDPVQLYRIKTRWEAQRRLSTYPGRTSYVYYTRENPFVKINNGREAGTDEPGELYEVVPDKKEPLPVCSTASKFDLACFSGLTPKAGRFYLPPQAPDGAVGTTELLFPPVLLAAIDPEQEERLLDLDGAIVEGRYLGEREGFEVAERGLGALEEAMKVRQAPVIASTRTFVDSDLAAEVERLEIPRGTDVPEVLSDRGRVDGFLRGLKGETVKRKTVGPGPVYDSLLDVLAGRSEARFVEAGGEVLAYWSSAPVRYEWAGEKRLRPLKTDNPKSIWDMPFYGGAGFPAPPGSEDVQFRKLTPHAGNNEIVGAGPEGGGLSQTATVKVVGRFDPERLPGFSPLSEVPLETYYPPSAEPADARTSRLLGGKPLLPSMNLGGYLSQPPLMLTTLEAAEGTFSDPRFYGGADKEKPISVIRVRVAGVKGADKESLERIRRVAQEIRQQTGLAVDVTAGSSPTPVTVELPKGKYGRPELTLSEGWVRKGVAVEVLEGVDRKSAALFGLVLFVCGFFLANGALASVRARRRELGVLMALGWSRARVFSAVLGELALIGLLAGLLGAVLAAVLVEVLSLELPLWRAVLVVPVSALLAVAAGLLPAALAARGAPMDALVPPVSAPRAGREVRSIAAMALSNLLRLPGRAALGVAGTAMGVAALVVLLGINLSFYGALAGSALGDFLTTQVRPVDYLSVALAIALGALSVADVLWLNLRERAPELVTLRTFGWKEGHLRLLGLLEGLTMGLSGSLAGAALGLAVVGFLGGGVSPTLLGLAALAALGGAAAALLASLGPLLALSRLTPPAVLAEE
jgi:hypothetical protein